MTLDRKSKQKAWLIAALVVLTGITIGIVWWVFSGDSEPLFITGGTPATRPAARPRATVGSVRYLNDLNGGNWMVNAGQAAMHVNTSGSYLFLSVTGGILTSKQSALFAARAHALKAKDDPTLNLTADQIEKLEGIKVANHMDTDENIAVMRAIWTDYQQTLSNEKLNDATKKAAERKVIDALVKISETSLEPTRRSYLENAKIVESIFTPDQVRQLSKTAPRRTTATSRR